MYCIHCDRYYLHIVSPVQHKFNVIVRANNNCNFGTDSLLDSPFELPQKILVKMCSGHT